MASSMGNSVAETQAKHGVQECVSLSWYSFDPKYHTIEEWADLQAESLWDNRTFLEKQRDLEDGIVVENYKSWALEAAQDLNEEKG